MIAFTVTDFHAFLAKGDVWSWSATLALTLTLTLVAQLVIATLSRYLRRLSSHTPFQWDDIAINVLAATRGWAVFFWILNGLEKLMDINPRIERATDVVAVWVTAGQVIIWAFAVVRGWHQTYLEARVQRDASSAAALGLLYTFLRATIVVVVGLSALNNLGVDVHALVAGLGVGSLAIVFGVQNILKDLLASFSIVLDKPFAVGDSIVVGDLSGTVEAIGIKTTRVRSNSGEQIIFSNTNLLEARVRNYRTLTQRRVVLKFGVTQSTAPDRLREIPGWIRGVVESQPSLKFDRCHFAYLGDSSFDYELVFFTLTADYGLHMDLQQRVLIETLECFARERVDLAYPSRSVYVEKFPPGASQPTHS